jgi:flavin-dependent dehydrogenase
MSLSAVWERFWWASMVAIGVGLLWLKFFDAIVPTEIGGVIFSSLAGIAYFSVGMRKMIVQRRREIEIERKAYEEWLAREKEMAGWTKANDRASWRH